MASPGWQAHAQCPDHIRYILEKTLNEYPRAWLEEPVSGEVFSSVAECQNRLIAFSLSQGFDIVISHSTQTPQVSKTFSCVHHGQETRNTRKLPPTVERNEHVRMGGW
jgi:hypothetical protein